MKKNNRYRDYLFVWDNQADNLPKICDYYNDKNFVRIRKRFRTETQAIKFAESFKDKSPAWFKKYHKYPKKLQNPLGIWDYELKDLNYEHKF